MNFKASRDKDRIVGVVAYSRRIVGKPHESRSSTEASVTQQIHIQ